MAFHVKQSRTVEEQLRIIEEVEKNPSEKRIDIAKRLGLPPSTLNAIVARKEKIREHADKCGATAKKRRRDRESVYSDLENVLFAWYQQACASHIHVNGSILREKSLEVAARMGIVKFSASNGWLSRFKERHGLVFKKLAGDSAAVDSNVVELWLERLPSLLEGYEAGDIYNADESGLFYNCLPDQTSALIGETCHGGKSAKERLTVLLCTNCDGSDKRMPIVIGKSGKPQCFKHVKTLPVTYYANSKSWMTSEIFRDFLRSFDASFNSQGRKILLFVDDCAAHCVDASSLKNVKLVLYPPNCTSIVQPLDLGVIKCFKQVYRRQLVQMALCSMDAAKEVQVKINILQAIHFLVSAWKQVAQSTIQNCFVKCGYLIKGLVKPEILEVDESSENDFMRDEDWGRLRASITGVDFDTYVSVDRDLVTCGVLSVENMCGEASSKNCGDTGQNSSESDDNAEPESVPSFVEALCAFQSFKAFMYAHDISDKDQANIVNLESSFLRLRKSCTKQKKSNDFLK